MSDKPTLTDDVASVDRDAEGNIVPENVDVTVNGTEYVTTVKPLVAGDVLKYENKFNADMDELDETAINLIWDNHVVGLDSDWKDVRLPVFMDIIEGLTGMSEVSDEVTEAIDDREQELEEGN